ncbi:MAG: ABC transporter substrate-binding protein [Promethearchaeota archaeon]
MEENKIKLISIFLIINFFSVNVYDQTIQANPVIQDKPDSQQIGSDTLIIGKYNIFGFLDPTEAWDSYSFDVIDQVCEGLFANDLRTQNMEIIPRLASNFGTWSDNLTEFTVPLRQNVTFHNGYEFNASVVKFTFDRIENLLDLGLLYTEFLFTRFGAERLINRTIIVDPYTIKFVLNFPFQSFISLLCFSPTYIVEEHSIPWDKILEDNDTLIGTGPYKYISHDEEEVIFEYFPDYYRGVPDIKEIIYKKYNTEDETVQALLEGDIHFSNHIGEDNLEDFIASEEIMIEESKVKAEIYYLAMNNKEINTTIRRAINYAIDYDYIINDILENQFVRMTSMVPPGILYHKECDVPTFDLNTARQILINAGLSKGLTMNSLDCDWIALSFTDPIMITNYTYNFVNEKREIIGYSIEEKLRYIGISVSLDGCPYDEYLNKILTRSDDLDLLFTGWVPDYNDPSNFLNNLLSNTSANNYFQVNDSWLELKMNESLYEPVESVRREMYYQIQEYIALNLMPFAQIGFKYSPSIHSYKIKNMPFNPLNKLYFYMCGWDPDTDEDGIIDSKETHLYFTDSNDNDTDNDGLSDGEEINTYFTNPNELDSDEDGMPDGWEVSHRLNPLSDDASPDIDNDGLTNLEEFIYNTDPNDSDSDNDGLLDGEEVVLGSDGYITDPNNSDCDNDTFSDGEEAERETDPLNSHDFPTFWTDYSETIIGIGAGIVGAIFSTLIGIIFKKRKKKKEKLS